MSILVNSIFKQINNLTLIETFSLVKKVEKKYGLDALELANLQSISAQVPKEELVEKSLPKEKAEEKQTFAVTLLEVAQDKKIPILKILRNITNLGLKESKELIDNLPKKLKESLTKEDAEALKSELEGFGAKAQIS